jgi:hypothetical protein
MVRELFASAYAAFNRRDIEGALSAMRPDVEWANGLEGGFVRGHEGVRTYWTRQWQIIDPHVEPIAAASSACFIKVSNIAYERLGFLVGVHPTARDLRLFSI